MFTNQPLIVMEFLIPLFLATVVGLIHLGGERVHRHIQERKHFWTSLSAGVTVTYIFLVLLPEVYQGTEFLGNYEFLMVLTGFSTVYLFKELVYRETDDWKKLRKDLREFHTVFLSVYYFCIGVLFHTLGTSSMMDVYLLFVPVVLHTGFSSLALKKLHEDVLNMFSIKVAVSFSAVAGVLTAAYLPVSETVLYSVLGLISGMFFYIVMHDSLKPERDSPEGYLTGLAIYSVVIIVIWSLF